MERIRIQWRTFPCPALCHRHCRPRRRGDSFMNRLARPLQLLELATFSTRSLSPAPYHFRFNRRPLSVVLPAVKTLGSKHSPFTSSTDHSFPPDPAAAAAEDYIHIEEPNPNAESLGESFVGVEDDSREDEDVAAAAVAPSEACYGDREMSDWGRATLPEELSRSVMVLTCESSARGGICVVHLVGTCHVSQDSCREVQAVISCLKPEVVFLELCASRVTALRPRNLKVPTMGEMVDMWKKKHNAFGIIYSWFLAKVGQKLEVLPGSEFRVAFEEAMKYGGKVILGDRPVRVTFRRSWAKMPLWHKTKLIYSLLFHGVFLPSTEDLNKMLKDMDDVDMRNLSTQELSKEFPTLMDTLGHERDQYMSHTLLKAARQLRSVVAVVGRAHLKGIERHWKQPVELKDLLHDPPRKQGGPSTLKVLSSVGVAVAGVAIIAGLYAGWKK